MSILNKPRKVKPVFVFFSNNTGILDSVENLLIKKFGKTDYKSRDIDFIETGYYEEEMGKDLKTRYISFEKLIPRDKLPELKLFAVKLEKKFVKNNKRIVNIDPGILSMENFILATGKSFTHRIYQQKGVYADLTLMFQNGGYVDLPWTFPSYKSLNVKKVLTDMRKIYSGQLKEHK